jgi:hypothetical protein
MPQVGPSTMYVLCINLGPIIEPICQSFELKLTASLTTSIFFFKGKAQVLMGNTHILNKKKRRLGLRWISNYKNLHFVDFTELTAVS